MKNKFKAAGASAAIIITVFTLKNSFCVYKYEKPAENKTEIQSYRLSRSGYNNMKNFTMPCSGTLTSAFGTRNGRMHKGIDIGAPYGTPLHCSSSGTVTFAGWQEGYGNVIIINHGNNIETVYAHCKTINVKKSQKVTTGEKIGEVGSTGRSTGPHVHFEIRLNGTPMNPQNYLKQV
ncbi:MAG: M23 family metallopeptidase [Solirubrobacterales bacterium]